MSVAKGLFDVLDFARATETHPHALRPVVVQKYGGSSVATAERLKQVAARIAGTVERGRRVVVVVSAMGKTTDELLSLARTVSAAPSRRELDMLLSSGERIAMALLAMALCDLGVPAISFTGSQSGIITNDRHSGARIIEVRPIRIQDELERDRVVIVAGFQGMSYKREITTLGRGGSDTTAVALAAALGAESCEIYSDVDGVYSADPRLVPEAAHLPQLGYEEMQELAAHGAKVLNAQAVEWAARAGIVIHARKTADAHGEGRETRIGPGRSSSHGTESDSRRATAVTASQSVLMLSSRAAGAAVLATLRSEGATLRHLELSMHEQGAALDVTLVRDDLPDWSRTEAALRGVAGADLLLREDLGVVTAVGPALGGDPSLLLSVAEVLQAAAIPVVRYQCGPLRLSAFLPSAAVPEATKRLHALLCAAPVLR